LLSTHQAFSAKLQSIPWRHIKSSLLERDAEEERERLRKERDAAHLEQGAAAASMGKMLSVKNLFGESMAGALMEKILGQASFCGVGPEAVWSGNGKDACDKMLKTKLRLTLNKLSVPKEDPGGAQEMVLAASWQAPPNRVCTLAVMPGSSTGSVIMHTHRQQKKQLCCR
jgi:hypothetical protein